MQDVESGVSVIDDREEFANPQRLRPPINPVVGNIAETLADWKIDDNTYIVIVTRGHLGDERVLGAILDSSAKYIGMIGSRRKIGVIFNDLKREGATLAALKRVHAPIGLDINSVTTEEIVLSIAAQLVQIRRQDHQQVIEGPIPLEETR